MARPGTVLTKKILKRHGARPDLRLWSNPTTYAYVGQKVGTTPQGHIVLKNAHPMRAGLVPKGASDMIGITDTGRFIAIEVKVGKDQLRPDQRNWLKMIEFMGGIAGVARSVEDVDELLGPPPGKDDPA